MHTEEKETSWTRFCSNATSTLDLVEKSCSPTEVDKVLWVTTYLRGRALAWMQVYTQDLLTYQATPDEQQPLTRQIFGDYAVFKAQIRKIFGEIDPVRKAERELRGLRQSGSAAKYAALFRMHSAQTGWDEAALTTLFYFGLTDE